MAVLQGAAEAPSSLGTQTKPAPLQPQGGAPHWPPVQATLLGHPSTLQEHVSHAHLLYMATSSKKQHTLTTSLLQWNAMKTLSCVTKKGTLGKSTPGEVTHESDVNHSSSELKLNQTYGFTTVY